MERAYRVESDWVEECEGEGDGHRGRVMGEKARKKSGIG